MSTENRPELLERYKLAYAEYRAEVALGWDRQKLFLTLPSTITALTSALATHRLAAQAALLCAVLLSLTGMLVVWRSHGRYRATRQAMQALEDRLGIEDLQTTGGQREARGLMRLEAFRIVDVLIVVFAIIGALDLALLALW
jgi:hypothetical protein